MRGAPIGRTGVLILLTPPHYLSENALIAYHPSHETRTRPRSLHAACKLLVLSPSHACSITYLFTNHPPLEGLSRICGRIGRSRFSIAPNGELDQNEQGIRTLGGFWVAHATAPIGGLHAGTSQWAKHAAHMSTPQIRRHPDVEKFQDGRGDAKHVWGPELK